MGKNFVLSGYFGFKNFGDEAILDVLLSKINLDNNNITVITSNPTYTKNKLPFVNCVKTFDLLNIIRTIFNSDILISGGGSLLQDATSVKSLFYYLCIIFIALFFQKRVIIFAQGIGPINSNIGKFLTKNILKHCYYITVRDEKSLNLLKKWKINANLVCDPIFSIEIPQNNQKENIVGVQLRDFKTMNDEFISRLAHKVCEEFPDKKIEIYSFQDDIDEKICKKFYDTLKQLSPAMDIELFTNLSNTEIINLVTKNEYLIGMRFHSIILGLLGKVKILSINYDIKVEKISKEFNLPSIELCNFDNFEKSFGMLKTQILPNTSAKIFDWSAFLKKVYE